MQGQVQPTALAEGDMDAFIFGSAFELLIGFSGFVALYVGTVLSHFRETESSREGH
jgi:hypothetical protein